MRNTNKNTKYKKLWAFFLKYFGISIVFDFLKKLDKIFHNNIIYSLRSKIVKLNIKYKNPNINKNGYKCAKSSAMVLVYCLIKCHRQKILEI